MKWDSWPSTSEDYHLRIGRSADDVIVASGTNLQNGTQPPRESACYTNPAPAAANFFVGIERVNTATTPRIDVFTTGGGSLQYQTPDGSVTEPGSAPETMAAAAICWQNNALESFSSRGPTIDGRTKPDISGMDSISNGTFGNFVTCGNSGFTGTSAAAPTIAGAAALAKQANPSFTPAELQAFLEGRAMDLGSFGKDTSFGSGKVTMGATPACPSPRPNLARSLAPISSGRIQVTLSSGFGSLGSITATKLTDAQVELQPTTLTSNGQSSSLTGLSKTFFVQRTSPGGSYTAELSLVDACGSYPLFFGAGS
jgi:hypothetical protein